MLSALIPSVHSYPAVQLVLKPVDQRYVQPSPLVLGPTPLKYQRLQQIETNLSHAFVCFANRGFTRNYEPFSVIANGLDYTTFSMEKIDVLAAF